MALRLSKSLQFFVKNSFNETKRKICLYSALNQNNSKQTNEAKTSVSKLPLDKEDKPKSEKISRAMVAFLQRQDDYGWNIFRLFY
jgi:hypothetical protein